MFLSMVHFSNSVNGDLMLVEVIPAQSEVKEIRRADQSLMGLKQEVYAHMPNSAFPVRCFVRVDKPLQPGKYNVSLPYKVGKYGDIEVNPFETPEYSAARPEQVKAAS